MECSLMWITVWKVGPPYTQIWLTKVFKHLVFGSCPFKGIGATFFPQGSCQAVQGSGKPWEGMLIALHTSPWLEKRESFLARFKPLHHVQSTRWSSTAIIALLSIPKLFFPTNWNALLPQVIPPKMPLDFYQLQLSIKDDIWLGWCNWRVTDQ